MKFKISSKFEPEGDPSSRNVGFVSVDKSATISFAGQANHKIMRFKIHSKFKLAGDQPNAVKKLSAFVPMHRDYGGLR